MHKNVSNKHLNVSVTTADPTALGLFGLAMVTLVASTQKLGITTGTSYLIPWVIFLGASAQLFACINDSKRNNTFGTTAFGAYAFFWYSVGLTWMIKMGALGNAFLKFDTNQLGIAFIGYLVFSLYMTIGAAKIHKVLLFIFLFIDVLFMALIASTFDYYEFFATQIAGTAEMAIAILSFYGSAASVLNVHFGRVVIPVGSPKIKKEDFEVEASPRTSEKNTVNPYFAVKQEIAKNFVEPNTSSSMKSFESLDKPNRMDLHENDNLQDDIFYKTPSEAPSKAPFKVPEQVFYVEQDEVQASNEVSQAKTIEEKTFPDVKQPKAQTNNSFESYVKDLDRQIDTKIGSEAFERSVPQPILSEESAQHYIKKDVLVELIENAFIQNATDIYIDEYQGISRLRYKVNGKFIAENTSLKVLHADLVHQILSRSSFIAQSKQDDSGRLTLEKVDEEKNMNIISHGTIEIISHHKTKFLLKVMIFPSGSSEKIVLSFAKTPVVRIALEQLGISKADIQTIKSMLQQGSGIIAVSGKNEALRKKTYYTLLSEIQAFKSNVFSLEKKISQHLNSITQLEFGNLEGISIDKTIQNIAEFGVDVIAVDFDLTPEITKCLIDISLSGKLILLSTPYQSAYETITNLYDLSGQSKAFPSSMLGFISQKTFMMVCQRCSELVLINSEKIQRCPACGETENCKSINVFEVIQMKNEFTYLVNKSSEHLELKDLLSKEIGSYSNNISRLTKCFVDDSCDFSIKDLLNAQQ